MNVCKQQGHNVNEAQYICICQGCRKSRLICDLCLRQNIHQHNYEYFVSIKSFMDVNCSLFDPNIILLTDEVLNHIVQKQIITIDYDQHNKKILQYKQSIHKKQSIDLQVVFSNNKQLIVTWAKDENLKIWHRYKLIRKKKTFIGFGLFSKDDQYFYIGQLHKLIILDVQQNFKLSGLIQLDINRGRNTQFATDLEMSFNPRPKFINNIKLITNHIVLLIFYLKQITQKIILDDSVRSLDYQISKQVILVSTNVISLWDLNGNLILKNNGGFLQKITQLNYSSFIPLIANFVGDYDKIITVNPDGVIIWFINYNNKLFRQIHLVHQYYNIQQLKINYLNLLREQDLISFSLKDNHYKVRNHKFKILQPLTEVNNFQEMVVQNYQTILPLDKLLVIRSSFHRL